MVGATQSVNGTVSCAVTREPLSMAVFYSRDDLVHVPIEEFSAIARQV